MTLYDLKHLIVYSAYIPYYHSFFIAKQTRNNASGNICIKNEPELLSVIYRYYKIQDTRCKIFHFNHEAHSYNTIYIDLSNKILCIIDNDKNTISTSLKYRDK